MLADQRYDGHKSIHDDAMAEGLGLRAGPIEGPTHFSQFDPLLYHVFGKSWFETGCISAHYQNMVVEGEEVRAFAHLDPAQPHFVRIHAEKRDGTPVLTGTASVGNADDLPHELRLRVAKLRPPTGLVINRDLRVGQRGARNRSGIDSNRRRQLRHPDTCRIERLSHPLLERPRQAKPTGRVKRSDFEDRHRRHADRFSPLRFEQQRS